MLPERKAVTEDSAKAIIEKALKSCRENVNAEQVRDAIYQALSQSFSGEIRGITVFNGQVIIRLRETMSRMTIRDFSHFDTYRKLRIWPKNNEVSLNQALGEAGLMYFYDGLIKTCTEKMALEKIMKLIKEKLGVTEFVELIKCIKAEGITTWDALLDVCEGGKGVNGEITLTVGDFFEVSLVPPAESEGLEQVFKMTG